jgi:hypothetical protein
MPPCSICTHAQRAEIDQRLVKRVPLRQRVAELRVKLLAPPVRTAAYSCAGGRRGASLADAAQLAGARA